MNFVHKYLLPTTASIYRCTRFISGKKVHHYNLKYYSSSFGLEETLYINEDGRQVNIQLSDDAYESYHSIWLRHNCRCDTCIQPHSGQKLIDITEIPERLTLSSVAIQPDGKTVHIKWKEEPEHTGIMQLDFLKKHCYSKEARHKRAHMCDYSLLQGNIEYFNHNKFMSCKKTFLRAIKNLNEFGVCVIDEIPSELEADGFEEIGKKLGGIQRTLYGEMFYVAAEERPINIAYTTVGLNFHMDLCYYESVPGLQLLRCTRFDDVVVGGESILLDVFYVAEELREKFPSDFETLCRVPATFQKMHFERETPAAYQYQRPHINIHPVTKHITAVTWSPPFEGVLHVDEADVEPYYQAYRRFTKLINNSNLKKQLKLKPGQCIVFNNRRILHGRKSFQLNGGQRHMMGCYVNIDDFKSTVQMEHIKQETGELARRLGNQCLF